MDKYTPARDIKMKDLGKNSEAFRGLLDLIPVGSVRRVVDVRYGLGGWAREVHTRFPSAKIIGFERDEATAEQSWKTKNVGLHRTEFNQPVKCDLLVADFNTVTQLKRSESDFVLGLVTCEWLVFTDVCCSKLHLNYHSYGISSSDLEAYWKGYEVKGFELVAYEKKHHAASSGLFKRKSPGG